MAQSKLNKPIGNRFGSIEIVQLHQLLLIAGFLQRVHGRGERTVWLSRQHQHGASGKFLEFILKLGIVVFLNIC